MSWCQIGIHGKKVIFGLSLIAGVALLSSCEGNAGATGPEGPPGPPGTTASSANELSISIDNVTINSAPVVELTVTDENGIPLTGLTTSNLRFNIAKLVPGTNGDSSAWQDYINRIKDAKAGSPGEGTSALQGTYENTGTLEDKGNGQYTYTFATDITDPASTVGGITYEPGLTHRVAIQVSGFPPANPTYDFRPSDGATSGLFSRDIVKIENCNQCHNKLAMHGGGRIDTKYCVTCHNPGSTDPSSGNTVDFKVLIHKVHRGADLPSVVAGGSYNIYGFSDIEDFSNVKFPQDIRNCTKCHDGSDAAAENFTAQGDNWKTQPSWQACGSCHDDIDFTKNGVEGAANYDPSGHPGGILGATLEEINNSECLGCHAENKVAGSIEEKHAIPEQLARARFQYNILKICGVDVGTSPGPICAPGSSPTVTFSVTDPTNADAKYDIFTTPEINGSYETDVRRKPFILIAWDNMDYNNIDNGLDVTDGYKPPSAANSIPVSAAVEEAPAGSRIYTVDATDAVTLDKTPVASPFIIPDGTGPNGYTATGSGTVAFQGRLIGDFDGDGTYNETLPNGDPERIYPKSVVASFRIDDDKVVARRQVVDNAKCNKCHEQVSLHGGSRNGEALVCTMCHNPNQTDVKDRPRLDLIVTGDKAGDINVAATLDGKREESVDFRRMIHGIHAGAETNYDGSEAHGFRENGLFIGSSHDFSDVRFPGILQDCETCHLPGTYELDGDWELPTENGILSSTIAAAPLGTTAAEIGIEVADPTDDLNISPTAAVCSSCHDGALAKAHMEIPGGAVFAETQGVITDTPVIETCAVCHGPGRDADVERVHASR